MCICNLVFTLTPGPVLHRRIDPSFLLSVFETPLQGTMLPLHNLYSHSGPYAPPQVPPAHVLSSPCWSSDIHPGPCPRVQTYLAWSTQCLSDCIELLRKKEEEAPFAPTPFQWGLSSHHCTEASLINIANDSRFLNLMVNSQFLSHLTFWPHLIWSTSLYSLKHFLHMALSTLYSHRLLLLNFICWFLLGSSASSIEVFQGLVLVLLFFI